MDHLTCSFDFNSIKSDLFIIDKLPSSDHLPLCCACRFELDFEFSDSSGDDVIVPSINYQWCKASEGEIEHYHFSSQIHLSGINIPDAVRYSILHVFVINTKCNSMIILVAYVKHYEGSLTNHVVMSQSVICGQAD